MSSIHVEYQFRKHRASVTCNSTLQETLLNSVKFFKLDTNDKQFSYVLQYNKRNVSLDIPLRLLNLPTNVALQLVKIENNNANRNVSKEDILIKVKFQIVGKGSIIAMVNNQKMLSDVIDGLGEKNRFVTEDVKLEVLNKIYNKDQMKEISLNSLGVSSPLSMRLTLNDADANNAKDNGSPIVLSGEEEGSNDKVNETSTSDINNKTEEIFKEEKHEMYEPKVFVPSNTPIENISSPYDENDYNMTLDSARLYQHVLSQQAGGNPNSPLLTKRLRALQETKKEKLVKQCTVRIRFPDRAILEMDFLPNDTTTILYRKIKDKLQSASINFSLYTSHPHTLIESSDDIQLHTDLGFGTKTLLLFQPESNTTNTTFLKSELLNDATSTYIPEIKPAATEQTTATPLHAAANTDTPSQKAQSQVPKWLRLSKK